MNKAELFKKCADFHGHECGGLTIGFQAAMYAIELLKLEFSEDEEVVCVVENDACGVDGIQVLLGCSVGKGNLLFKLRGKQAFSVFNRKTGESVRLVLKQTPDMPRENRASYLFDSNPADLFEVKKPDFELPEEARIFQSYPCAVCGENTADHFMRLQDGERVCLDCFKPYVRFMN